MVPECGSSCPVSWLIRVVLPAPLGPMTACNSPRATSSETLSVATIPPNRRTRFSTLSKGSATTQPPQQPENAAAPEHHHQITGAGPVHHCRTDEVGVVGEQRAGETAHGARDNEANQTVAAGGKSD